MPLSDSKKHNRWDIQTILKAQQGVQSFCFGAEYIGAWRSVNDVQAQLGKDKFAEFIEDVERIITKRSFVEVHYLTRAWIACK